MANFCHSCGEPVAGQSSKCPSCGTRLKVVSIETGSITRGRKDKLVAGLLAIFLGGLGIDKFYLGKPGLGILFLLTCWTIIMPLVAFIQGILYLAMSDAEFDAKYNSD